MKANADETFRVYEPAQASLVVLPFPSITVPRGYRAMRKLQEVFATYYEEERHMKNPDCAEFVRRNAIAAEDGGMTRRHVGILNFSLAGAAIMNTAPSVYWMICTIFSRKDLLQRVRQELLQKVDRDGSAATLDISRVEAECPLLVSCYREMMRLLSQFVIARKVVEDTTLRDGKGNSYLFKKGAMVQVPTAASHHSGDAWGDSVEEFDPDRFMPSNVDKSKRTAYFPFGGGRHLCPGRQFAFMETLALTAALVVGFEVMPTGKGWDGVKPAGAVLGASVLKPERDGEGQGVMVWRREGWEDVTWKFTT
jgi:cytochrome P450